MNIYKKLTLLLFTFLAFQGHHTLASAQKSSGAPVSQDADRLDFKHGDANIQALKIMAEVPHAPISLRASARVQPLNVATNNLGRARMRNDRVAFCKQCLGMCCFLGIVAGIPIYFGIQRSSSHNQADSLDIFNSSSTGVFSNTIDLKMPYVVPTIDLQQSFNNSLGLRKRVARKK